MTSPTPDFLRILETLSKYQVDFIVVGGVCAVIHGAPITTFDLDLVHSRVPENLTRLLLAYPASNPRRKAQAPRA